MNVRCSLTDKQHTVKVKDLSKEDGVLSEKDLERGNKLILAYKGKHYLVSLLQFKGEYIHQYFQQALLHMFNDVYCSTTAIFFCRHHHIQEAEGRDSAKRKHKEKAHQA